MKRVNTTHVTDRRKQNTANLVLILLVASASALVVVALYEVGGRRAKRAPQADGLARASEQVTAPPVARTAVSPDQTCADLRGGYLARCPGDLLAALTPVGQPASADDPAKAEREARAIADVTAWLKPSQGELADMANNCEVRLVIPAITDDPPPIVTQQQAAALSLSNQEHALLDRTLRELHVDLRDFAARAVTEVPGHPANASQLPLEEMLADLETRPENGFEEAKRKLAQERAGLASPPTRGAYQPPGERLLRLWSAMGDELERRLTDASGAERARQLLFSPRAVWTNRTSRSGCWNQP